MTALLEMDPFRQYHADVTTIRDLGLGILGVCGGLTVFGLVLLQREKDRQNPPTNTPTSTRRTSGS